MIGNCSGTGARFVPIVPMSQRALMPAPEASPLGNRKPFTEPKIAEITINISSVEEIMPPIIGTAMRCMT